MRKVVRALQVVCLSLAGIFALHDFFSTTNRAPQVTFDDGLAQVSVILSREGRLGFDAVPVLHLANSTQIDGFFNYGPWYFMMGAVADWMFGTSFTVQRFLHPLGLAFVIAIAFHCFGRDSAPRNAWFVFASAVILEFHLMQWPMVRPDILGSMAAAVALLAASSVMRGAGAKSFFLLGLAVGIAVTNHPVAVALVPWSLGVALVGLRKANSQADRLRDLAAWSMGGAIAALGLIAAGGFRPVAMLRLYVGYPTLVGAYVPHGFFESIQARLRLASMPGGHEDLWAAGMVFVVLVDSWLAFARPTWRVGSASSLLPGWAFVLYVASEGILKNQHSGYEILTQVLFAWTVAGLVARAGVAAIPMGTLATAVAAWVVIQAPSRFELEASGNVGYPEYLRAVRDGLPPGARVQGDAAMALDRSDWIEMDHVSYLGSLFRPSYRERLLPDAIVVLESTWRTDCLYAATGSVRPETATGPIVHTYFGHQNWVLGQGDYALERLVFGAPYRVTSVYRRAEKPRQPPRGPSIAFWSARNGWSRELGEVSRPFAPGEMSFAIPGGPSRIPLDRRIEAGLTANLPAGGYLLEIGDLPDESCVVASRFDRVTEESQVDGTAHVFPRQDTAYILLDHPGGELHLAVMSAASMVTPPTVSVRRVMEPRPFPERPPYTRHLLRCLRDPMASGCASQSLRSGALP